MNKNYQSNIKRVKYKLTEEEKKALTDIGKMLKIEIKRKARRLTGKLRKNIGYKVMRKDKSVQVGVKNKGFYGFFFEKGTKKMQKDPFVLPSVEEKKDEIQQIIKDHLKKLGR
jgi:HK97 gp10 family phage protein